MFKYLKRRSVDLLERLSKSGFLLSETQTNSIKSKEFVSIEIVVSAS